MNHPLHCFVDGLGDVRLHAGMVRIDFVVHDADPAQPGASHHRAARLVMTPQALLQVVQGLAQAASQLQPRPAVTGPVPLPTRECEPQAGSAPSRLAPDLPGRSPNFSAS